MIRKHFYSLIKTNLLDISTAQLQANGLYMLQVIDNG
jgi:hypothetical protein